MSPSVAESIRSVFAAFVWHEGIVHDAMAVASYLKFDPTLTKQGSLSTRDGAGAAASAKEDRARQRHSVEVISPSYLLNYRSAPSFRAPVDPLLEKSTVNANTNRNITGCKLDLGVAECS
jgi:E3 ubiquitin-protein ligase MYCBP2